MDLNSLIPKDPNDLLHLAVVVLLAGVAILAAIGLVVLKSPIRAAMCLVINFFALAFIYFSLGAELMGITQIVVYTGAIMVLFLFVIMLLNLSSDNPLENKKDIKPFVGPLVGFGLFGLLASQLLLPMLSVKDVSAPDRSIANPIGWGQPQAVGRALFTGYVWPFEIVSLLLLIGIVGAILLARRRVVE